MIEVNQTRLKMKKAWKGKPIQAKETELKTLTVENNVIYSLSPSLRDLVL